MLIGNLLFKIREWLSCLRPLLPFTDDICLISNVRNAAPDSNARIVP